MPTHGSTIIRWREAEYLLLAQTLIARYPKRNFGTARSAEALNFDHAEFDIVQRKALPKSRQRIMQSLELARQHIFEAVVKLRGGGGSAEDLAPATPAASGARHPRHRIDKNPRVVWTEPEYKQFALALHSMNPQLHFLNSTDLAGLTTSMMSKAAQTMPEGRQRAIPALEAPRKILLDIYRKARAERDPLFYPPPQLPQPTKHPLPPHQERRMKRAPAPVVETEQELTVKEFTAAHKPAAVAPVPALPDGAPKSREKTIITWTREEWLLLATEMQRLRPGCYLADTGEMVGINSPLVARAQLVLPLARQRHKVANMTFSQNFGPKLLSAFRDLSNRQLTAATAAAKPTASAAQPASAPHAPPVTVPGTTAAPKQAGHNIRWTDDEWLAIATELHRRYPLLKLLNDKTLFSLSSPDVAAAQCILDPSRQRPNLKVVSFKTILRPHLLAAFKELKTRLANPAPAATEVVEAAAVAAPVAKVGSASPVVPIAAVPYTPPPAVTPAEVNVYEAALRPLVDLLVGQLAKQLQPMLARIIETAGAAVLAAATPAPPPPARAPSPFGVIFQADQPRPANPLADAEDEPPPLSTSPSGPSLPTYSKPAPQRAVPGSSAPPRRPQVGVVGGLEHPAHKNELVKEFPDIEFTFIDSPKHVKSIRNCDKVIAVKWASHSLTEKSKRTVGAPRFIRLDGGVSEMKRTIAIWIASGALPGMLASQPGAA